MLEYPCTLTLYCLEPLFIWSTISCTLIYTLNFGLLIFINRMLKKIIPPLQSIFFTHFPETNCRITYTLHSYLGDVCHGAISVLNFSSQKLAILWRNTLNSSHNKFSKFKSSTFQPSRSMYTHSMLQKSKCTEIPT